MSDLRVNDLFCGAGGMGLGFKYAGFRLGGAWDFDKWAVESYGENISPKVKQADITQMVWDELPKADVWTFGFPCQDLSVAGKQAGLFEGKRSGLFFEVMRLLDETIENDESRLPSVIMAENVKGLKPYLGTLKEEYNKLGYRMTYTLYNSKYWGVPQNRDRYFVVGIREDIRKAFQFPRQQTDFVPKLSSVLESEVDEKFYIDELKATKIIKQAINILKVKRTNDDQIQSVFTDKDGVAYCCDANYAKGISPGDVGNGRRTHIVEQPKIEVLGHLDKPNWREQWKRVYDPNGISPTLVCAGGGNHEPKILEQYRVRKLTPREYARLQGFPDSYKQVVSNSQFYKQMGNAVTVNVAQAIAEKIYAFLGGK